MGEKLNKDAKGNLPGGEPLLIFTKRTKARAMQPFVTSHHLPVSNSR